jgi:hypothetical protein
MRLARRNALAAFALLLAVAPLAGQGGAPVTKTGLSLTPFLGVIVPTKDLIEFNSETTKISTAFVLGVRLGIGFGQRFGIEGDIGYSPASLDYSSAGASLNQDVRILTGSARANLYLIPRTSPFWIGINGGVSAIRHTFKEGTVGSTDFEPGTNVGGVIGAAAGIRIGRLIAFHIGADDYIYSATFDVNGTPTSEKKQHDIRITGGVRIPFLGF